MLTVKDNLFNVIGEVLSTSPRDELYLTAHATFEATWVTPEIQRVLAVATHAAGCNTASSALAVHFNTCVSVQTSHQTFCDECNGVVQANNVAVEFSVRKISDSPLAYRVVFTRVDAGRLAVDAQERLARLEQLVAQLRATHG